MSLSFTAHTARAVGFESAKTLLTFQFPDVGKQLIIQDVPNYDQVDGLISLDLLHKKFWLSKCVVVTEQFPGVKVKRRPRIILRLLKQVLS